MVQAKPNPVVPHCDHPVFRTMVFTIWCRDMARSGLSDKATREVFDEDWADWEAAPERKKAHKRINEWVTVVQLILDALPESSDEERMPISCNGHVYVHEDGSGEVCIHCGKEKPDDE